MMLISLGLICFLLMHVILFRLLYLFLVYLYYTFRLGFQGLEHLRIQIDIFFFFLLHALVIYLFFLILFLETNSWRDRNSRDFKVGIE
jgi:hypothetical protein